MLVLVGYLTFYFDIENFTDRIMVVLTTMLVVATITSSIQQVITAPRTASSSASSTTPNIALCTLIFENMR